MHAHDHAQSPERSPAHVAAQPSPARSQARTARRPATDRPNPAQLRALQDLGFADGTPVQRLAADPGHAATGPSAVEAVLRRPGRPLPVAVRQEMEARRLKSQDADALQNEQDAIDILIDHAHELFPETFTCEADYYIASYDPDTPWYHSRDVGVYDAEA
jgi:hypothetical protein